MIQSKVNKVRNYWTLKQRSTKIVSVYVSFSLYSNYIWKIYSINEEKNSDLVKGNCK